MVATVFFSLGIDPLIFHFENAVTKSSSCLIYFHFKESSLFTYFHCNECLLPKVQSSKNVKTFIETSLRIPFMDVHQVEVLLIRAMKRLLVHQLKHV